MIGWLYGHIIDKEQPGKMVLDVNGVGYDVETSLQTFLQVETKTTPVGLHIHTVVREDALLLYGFYDKDERALFRALIKVNGIGPKLAITMLSGITPNEFVQCIQDQNTALLTKLPGIGKKTAERLVVEMKDTVLSLQFLIKPADSPTSRAHEQSEAICALESLGYKTQEATKTIKQLDDGQKTCEQLIREGLRQLSKV